MFVEITNEPRDYAWGSTTLIPELRGEAPDGRPQAEIWLGTHPGSPARLATGDGDLRELMRAASERRAAPERPPAVPRSRSVAMAKIDEDGPCDFGLAGAGVPFARSRSCAVSAGRASGQRGRAAHVPVA